MCIMHTKCIPVYKEDHFTYLHPYSKTALLEQTQNTHMGKYLQFNKKITLAAQHFSNKNNLCFCLKDT